MNPTARKFTERQQEVLYFLSGFGHAQLEEALDGRGPYADAVAAGLKTLEASRDELKEIMIHARMARAHADFAFKERLGKADAPVVSIPWQMRFRLSTDLEDGELIEYITGIVPEGVTFLGALSGVGKTWFALSLAHALLTGEKLFTIHAVTEKCNVLYLSPEVGDRAFRKRLKKMRVFGHPNFRCTTAKDGVVGLTDSSLESCCSEWNPIVFLDTAIRFNASSDENSSSQNAKLLAHDILTLLKWGAKAVVCLHHSPKYAKDAEYMTLENVLRGTGDIGAMCDAVWGIQHDKAKGEDGKTWDTEYEQESEQLTRLLVRCVKPRDFDPVPEFRIQGRPYIDERGQFVVLSEREDSVVEDRLAEAIASNPVAPMATLRKRFKMGVKRLHKLAEKRGWFWNGTQWHRPEAKF